MAWTTPFEFGSPRLTFCPCDAASAVRLRSIVADPQVAQPYYLGQTSGSLPRCEAEDWQQGPDRWAQKGRFVVAAACRHTSVVIGCVQLTPSRLSYFVARPFWNRGYGREMVLACCQFLPQRLGILALEAVVLRENMASRRILERAGFDFMGLATQERSDRPGSAMVLHYRRGLVADAPTA